MARTRLTPRRRPRSAEAQATVGAILTATGQILVRSELSAVRIQTIARRAGVSVGTLYDYFPNKASIVATLAAERLRSCEEALARSLLAGRAPAEALVDALLEPAQDEPALSAALAGACREVRAGLRLAASAQEMAKILADADPDVDLAGARMAAETARHLVALAAETRPGDLADPLWRERLIALCEAAMRP